MHSCMTEYLTEISKSFLRYSEQPIHFWGERKTQANFVLDMRQRQGPLFQTLGKFLVKDFAKVKKAIDPCKDSKNTLLGHTGPLANLVSQDKQKASIRLFITYSIISIRKTQEWPPWQSPTLTNIFSTKLPADTSHWVNQLLKHLKITLTFYTWEIFPAQWVFPFNTASKFTW